MMLSSDYIEQTSGKRIPVIFGVKVTLIPFLDVFDMDDFIRVHKEDRKGLLCRFCLKNLSEEEGERYIQNLIAQNELFIWNCILKGSDVRAGFIYLSNVTKHSASIAGVMDKVAIKKISREERKEKFDMTDDAIRSLIHICFQNGFQRIEADATADNREAIRLHQRLGFVREGVLRKAVNIDGQLKDLILVSILKEEFKNG